MISVTKKHAATLNELQRIIMFNFNFLIQRQSHDPLCYLLNNLP